MPLMVSQKCGVCSKFKMFDVAYLENIQIRGTMPMCDECFVIRGGKVSHDKRRVVFK